jgi:antitoxin component YwqK of YwqJK toxin-antitoxin module
MTDRINIKQLDFFQDDVGEWYYTLDNVPFTGCAYQDYQNGTRAAENNFVNGYQEGLQRQWFPNGQLKSEEKFLNNVQHGGCLEWYENGILRYECECNMGETIWSKSYNEKGELIKQSPSAQ